MKAEATFERFTRRMFTRIITSLSRSLAEHDLSVAEVAALYLLDERESLRVSELGAELARSAPTTSRLVDSLVAAGFVRRDEDPNDRRARVLSLTPKGSKFIAQAGEARVRTMLETVRSMPAGAPAAFLASLRDHVTSSR